MTAEFHGPHLLLLFPQDVDPLRDPRVPGPRGHSEQGPRPSGRLVGTWHPDIRDALRVSTASLRKMPAAPCPVCLLLGAQPLGFGTGGQGCTRLEWGLPTFPWVLIPWDLVRGVGMDTLGVGSPTVPRVRSPQDLVQGLSGDGHTWSGVFRKFPTVGDDGMN